MQVYKAPLRDMQFVIHELHDSATITSLPGLGEISAELIDSVLAEAGKFAEGVLLPINASGDEEGCTYENGVVRTPAGFKDAYRKFRDGGWTAIAASPEFGGQDLPEIVNKQIEEMISATNMSFGLYPGLTHGAYQAIIGPRHGRAEADLSAEDGRRHLVRHHVPDRSPLRHRSRHAADQGRPAGRWQLQDHRQQDLHLRRRA